MNKEIKRQLILTGILLSLLIGTLALWYDNFMFHSYVNVVDYQYCYGVETEDFMIDGYEFYKKDQVQMHGGARIAALKDHFFLKGDIIQLSLTIDLKDEDYTYTQEYIVKSDNEVCYFEEEETRQQLFDEDFSHMNFHLTITRDKKIVYDQDVALKSQEMVVYNGSNKDYSLQNVYASSSWLKTGSISTTVKGIEKEYPYITMDYLYLKDNGNEDNIDDYERFAHMSGLTKDVLEDTETSVAYYDGTDSLLDKKLICVVSLKKDESQEDMFTFMITLHGTIKAVDVNG